jgi:GDP-mannose transporter
METQTEVYYNNVLSIPLVCILIFAFGEHNHIATDPAFQSPQFLAIAAFSCGIGFSISYAALWFLSTTTPTTYSLVGSLNKIPVAIVGIVIFRAPTTPANLASILVGLIAGVLFVRAKQR